MGEVYSEMSMPDSSVYKLGTEIIIEITIISLS